MLTTRNMTKHERALIKNKQQLFLKIFFKIFFLKILFYFPPNSNLVHKNCIDYIEEGKYNIVYALATLKLLIFHDWYFSSTLWYRNFNNLTLALLVANLVNRKLSEKKLRNDRSPGTWVLIWEYSSRAIQWIPTWQGLGVFQKSLHPCA